MPSSLNYLTLMKVPQFASVSRTLLQTAFCFRQPCLASNGRALLWICFGSSHAKKTLAGLGDGLTEWDEARGPPRRVAGLILEQMSGVMTDSTFQLDGIGDGFDSMRAHGNMREW